MVGDKVDPMRIGEQFQERTKYHRQRRDRAAVWAGPVAPYKSYPASLPRVSLPPPELNGGPRLWDLIAARRSVRSYGRRPVELRELSQLLWVAQGVTGERRGHLLRATPSAGALYPVETYLAVHNVHALKPGLYHYAVKEHALTRLRSGDLRAEITRAAVGQEMCDTAALLFIWTAVVGRPAQKYSQRAYRYIYLDAGHVAQNVALACVGLGFGSCAIGALFDDEVNAILEVDGRDEPVIYMTAVGPV